MKVALSGVQYPHLSVSPGMNGLEMSGGFMNAGNERVSCLNAFFRGLFFPVCFGFGFVVGVGLPGWGGGGGGVFLKKVFIVVYPLPYLT